MFNLFSYYNVKTKSYRKYNINLNWNYFNLNWNYFNLNRDYFNFNWNYFNLNWSYFNSNWSYFNLKLKRCSYNNVSIIQ